MNIKELMEIDVTNLADTQHNALKNHTVGILETVIRLIEEEEYEAVKGYIYYSPSGDAYGEENYFINLGYNGVADINDILTELTTLKKQALKGEDE